MANSDPYPKWYCTAQWRALRVMVLARDPLCKKCVRVASTRVDHIKPHKGNWDLFVDLANLQGLCEVCHNQKTREEEAVEKPGDGNLPPTGTPDAAQFTSSAVGADALDRALAEED